MKRIGRVLWLFVLMAAPACGQKPLRGVPGYEQPPLAEQAAAALVRATSFFRTQVVVHGSYLWTYSDLAAAYALAWTQLASGGSITFPECGRQR